MGGRVVILATARAAGDELRGVLAVTPRRALAATAYEAAAELLAAPAVALVVDLRLLPRRHYGLLALARRLEVSVLAFGPLPAGAEAGDLSGATLLGPDELAAAVGRCAAAETQAAVEAPEALTSEPPKGPDVPIPEAPKGRYVAERPGDLLTADEISALLGRQS